MLAATGAQGVAMEKLADLIAASSTFQEARRQFSVAESERSIYWPFVDDPDGTKRPFAVIMRAANGLNWQTVAGGSQNYLRPSGFLTLRLASDVLAGDSKDAETEFANFAEGVIADLVEVAGRDDFLDIQNITQTVEPTRTHPANVPAADQSRAFYWCEYQVEWGTSE